MIVTKGLFIYRQGPLEQGLGIRIFALGVIDERQILQGDSRNRMVRTKCTFCNFQCLFGYLGRLCVPSLMIKQDSHVI